VENCQICAAEFQIRVAEFQIRVAEFQICVAEFQIRVAVFQIRVAFFLLLGLGHHLGPPPLAVYISCFASFSLVT
jgi:hypothetical protein